MPPGLRGWASRWLPEAVGAAPLLAGTGELVTLAPEGTGRLGSGP